MCLYLLLISVVVFCMFGKESKVLGIPIHIYPARNVHESCQWSRTDTKCSTCWRKRKYMCTCSVLTTYSVAKNNLEVQEVA